MKKFFKSRLGNCVIAFTIYFVSWKLSGFEITVIFMGAQIMGEIVYQNKST